MTKTEKLDLWIWSISVILLLYLAMLRTTHSVQLIVSVFLLSTLWLLYKYSKHAHNLKQKRALRLAIIFISIFISSRYIYWRASETLPTQFGIVAMVCGLMLFLAEAYGFVNTILGFIINSSPYPRAPIPISIEDPALPHIDVYIPTYNEEATILRPTVIAATQINYPKDKLHVYVLDDGGTAQKCSDKDPVKAAAAQERAQQLKEIAHKFGAGYITREKNLHAKAGNINNALKHTSGEFLVILDCDHIPTSDFIENTIGLFLHDPKLFLVQTPHNFISPDPLEKNLNTFEASPAENELFYDVMQPGLDFWQTSFFCGSAAMLRRRVIDELGGIAGQTITEDAETTIDALSLGYSTAYLNRPMVSGLQPETYSGFILQRVRWGQGMLQIFLLKNPWKQKGLKFIHRILYTNFTFFWGFASARLIMLLAPAMYLIFKINLCDATAIDLISYAGPALLASLISTQFFYGRVRWPFMSQLYEIIQSVYVSRGIIEVIRSPRSPSFKVTPKGEVLSTNFISSLTAPFYILLSINIVALISGFKRYGEEPLGEGAIAFVLFWAILDFIFLLGALGIMFERRQMRSEPRVAHREPVLIKTADGASFNGYTANASSSGVGVQLDIPLMTLPAWHSNSPVIVDFPTRNKCIQAKLLSTYPLGDKKAGLGLTYDFRSVEEERTAIDIAFGSSLNIQKNNARRHNGRSVVTGFLYLLKFGFKYGLGHILFLLTTRLFAWKNNFKKGTA